MGVPSPATPRLYYDPYDFEIDADPYPVWKRLRDEAPLYRNEKYEFFALSRWDDVDAAMLDWKTFISGRGSVLEIIKAGIEIPPGSILFEDPPTHDLHRGLLSRFHAAEDAGARAPGTGLLRRGARPAGRNRGFDFVADLGAFMPMRMIGMLLGIPEEDQEAIREQIDDGLRLEEGVPNETEYDASAFGAGVLRLHHLAGRSSLGRPHDRVAATPSSRTNTVRHAR